MLEKGYRDTAFNLRYLEWKNKELELPQASCVTFAVCSTPWRNILHSTMVVHSWPVGFKGYNSLSRGNPLLGADALSKLLDDMLLSHPAAGMARGAYTYIKSWKTRCVTLGI